MRDWPVAILVPTIILLAAITAVLTGAWAAMVSLIPRPVRLLTRRQPRWLLWVLFLFGLFLIAFSLGVFLRS